VTEYNFWARAGAISDESDFSIGCTLWRSDSEPLTLHDTSPSLSEKAERLDMSTRLLMGMTWQIRPVAQKAEKVVEFAKDRKAEAIIA